MYAYDSYRIQIWVQMANYNYKTGFIVHCSNMDCWRRFAAREFFHCDDVTRTYLNLLKRNFHAKLPKPVLKHQLFPHEIRIFL